MAEPELSAHKSGIVLALETGDLEKVVSLVKHCVQMELEAEDVLKDDFRQGLPLCRNPVQLALALCFALYSKPVPVELGGKPAAQQPAAQPATHSTTGAQVQGHGHGKEAPEGRGQGRRGGGGRGRGNPSSRGGGRGGQGGRGGGQSASKETEVDRQRLFLPCQILLRTLKDCRASQTEAHITVTDEDRRLALYFLPAMPPRLWPLVPAAFGLTAASVPQLIGGMVVTAKRLLQTNASGAVGFIAAADLGKDVTEDDVFPALLDPDQFIAAGEYCDTDKERWRRLFAFIDHECQRVVNRYGCHEERAQRLRTTAKSAVKLVPKRTGEKPEISYEGMVVLMDCTSVRYLMRQCATEPGEHWPELLEMVGSTHPHFKEEIDRGRDWMNRKRKGMSRQQDKDNKPNLPQAPPTMKCQVPVIMVDTMEKLDEALADLTTHGRVVGLDCEWRPTFTILQPVRCGLLQLAVDERVYLIDCVGLSQEAVSQFLTKLNTAKGVKVIGFGLSSDSALLFDMYKVSLSRPIDLVNVQKEVDERRWLKEKKKGPVQRDPNHLNSLVKLVEHYLGFRLDKTVQMSDWERRPLRPAQVEYAALDAHCLIGIYRKMMAELDETRLGWD